MGTTPIVRCTWCCHSCAGRPLETEPSGAKTAITIIIIIVVVAPIIRSPSASAVENPVVLTFWHKRGERTSVTSNVSFSCTSARSSHVRESKTVLDSGFYAMNSGFQVLDSSLCQWHLGSGFKSLEGLRIPKPRIVDSTSNFPDSGFHQQKFLGFRNPHSLTRGELEVKEGNFSCSKFPNHILTVDQQQHRKKTLLHQPISSIC